jgi:GrpB-like predicted nucleotidyltransferase (UPF0157 family)
MIEVVPYDKRWTVRFLELQRVLSDALRGIQVVSIEHVGGTFRQDLRRHRRR